VVVAVMHGNNEIGTVQPIHDIARAIQLWKEKHKGITRDKRPTTEGAYPVLLVDAAQSLQTHRLDVGRLGADLLAVGSAKTYGPKGVGALLSRTIAPMSPIIPGGSHESGRRAGTPSLPVLMGMVEAVTRAQSQTEAFSQHYLTLRRVLVGGLSHIPEVVIHGHPTDVLPHIVNFSVHGISHEYLALLLNTEGFSVATKSACHESDQDASHVLIALKEAGGAGDVEGIRVSFGRSTTVEQINQFLRVLPSQLCLAIASRDVTA
jgi:cysteine desulfurase